MATLTPLTAIAANEARDRAPTLALGAGLDVLNAIRLATAASMDCLRSVPDRNRSLRMSTAGDCRPPCEGGS
jgi:hypothetical protein